MSGISFKLTDPITKLPLVGPAYEEKLERLGITTIRDLLYHFPFRYEDTRNIITISQLRDSDEGTIEGIIKSVGNTKTRTRKWLTKALIEDGTGSISAVWFNQPYLTKALNKGATYLFSGKINRKWGGASLTNPQYEMVNEFDGDQTHLGKLSPKYPETKGVSSKWIRARLKYLEKFIPALVKDYIPEEILEEEKVTNLNDAIQSIHFPQSAEEITKGQKRLGLDELVRIKQKAILATKERMSKTSVSITKTTQSETLKSNLPFTLTETQEQSLSEILEDIAEDKPMYRLLNGDVGSGKTVVALLAAAATHDEGHTTVIMAPTTILAQQHYETITKLLNDTNIDIPVSLTTSSTKTQTPPGPHISIGTHALLHQNRLPEETALLVIDEQHRFGVKQRDQLRKLIEDPTPGAISPHYLTMTATPIPRTLTMALYGSTNVSTIDELPPGRVGTKTHLVPEDKRKDAYDWIREKLESGEQAFVICPLIDESEVLTAKSAKETYDHISKEIFPDHKIALVHGQQKDTEKNSTLSQFKEKKYDILVATPVVEVGIDIPNATIMIIESAERFGLAQLHQLRGRVGRGDKQAFCFLFTENPSEEATERLTYFSSHTSGFDVAEFDLKRRGPGEVYGTRQSGLLELRFADITDRAAIKKAERIALKLDSAV